MYPNPNALLFPSLVRIAGQDADLQRKAPPVVLGEPDSDGFVFEQDPPGYEAPSRRSIPLYRLDWRSADEAKVRAHETWMDSLHAPAKSMVEERIYPMKADRVPFTPLINLVWAMKLDNLSFAISEPYGQEIRRLTQMAGVEWDREMPFNKPVKEACLMTAVQTVQLAFYLLADCIWKAKENRPNGWEEGREKHLLKTVMLTRFWDSQTPEENVFEYAQADKLCVPCLQLQGAKNPDPQHVLFYESYAAQLKMRRQLEEPFRVVPERTLDGVWVSRPHLRKDIPDLTYPKPTSHTTWNEFGSPAKDKDA